MRYIYMIMMFYMFNMTSLNAKKSELSDILQKAGENKIIVKRPSKKKQYGGKTYFIFKDTFNPNGIGVNNNKGIKNSKKSKTYEYENKSRFKFKFTPGTGNSNIVGGQNTASASIRGGDSRGSSSGGGQGRGGSR